MEKELLINLINEMYSFIKGNKGRNIEREVKFSEDFTHPKYGSTTFSLILSINPAPPTELLYFLNFKINIGNSYIDRYISQGNRDKIVNDLEEFNNDPQKLENMLQDMYMGLLDYPRP